MILISLFSFSAYGFAQNVVKESDQIWYATKASRHKIFDDPKTSQKGLKALNGRDVIVYDRNTIAMPGNCTASLTETVTIPLTEWQSADLLPKYKEFFEENNLPLSNTITLIEYLDSKDKHSDSNNEGARPCNESYGELIKYKGLLLLIAGDFLTIYSRNNPHKDLGIHCRQLELTEYFMPHTKSVCYYPHQTLLEAYQKYAAKVRKLGIAKLKPTIIPMKNMKYDFFDPNGVRVTYQWTSPKKLLVTHQADGGLDKFEFEERDGNTSITTMVYITGAQFDDDE